MIVDIDQKRKSLREKLNARVKSRGSNSGAGDNLTDAQVRALDDNAKEFAQSMVVDGDKPSIGEVSGSAPTIEDANISGKAINDRTPDSQTTGGLISKMLRDGNIEDARILIDRENSDRENKIGDTVLPEALMADSARNAVNAQLGIGQTNRFTNAAMSVEDNRQADQIDRKERALRSTVDTRKESLKINRESLKEKIAARHGSQRIANRNATTNENIAEANRLDKESRARRGDVATLNDAITNRGNAFKMAADGMVEVLASEKASQDDISRANSILMKASANLLELDPEYKNIIDNYYKNINLPIVPLEP